MGPAGRWRPWSDGPPGWKRKARRSWPRTEAWRRPKQTEECGCAALWIPPLSATWRHVLSYPSARPIVPVHRLAGNKTSSVVSILAMISPEAVEPPNSVHIRPKSSDWVGAALFALFAIGAPVALLYTGGPSHAKAHIGIVIVLAMGLATPAILLLVALAQTEAIADEMGLRWRNWTKWYSCSWDQVLDYYEKAAQGRSRSNRREIVIETMVGKLRLSPYFLDIKPLRPIIQQRANSAKVTDWAVLGSREVDSWPQQFSYRTADNRFITYSAWFVIP